MLQRIQTVFLLVALISNLMLFQFDLWSGQATNDEGKVVEEAVLSITELQYNPSLEGQAKHEETMIWLIILTGITSALMLWSIFLYGNRQFQVKMVRFTMLLEAGLLALCFFYADSVPTHFVNEPTSSSYELGVFLPMIGVLCCFIANLYILKDERLVRSSERLR